MKLIKVGITHGDINGISLELITKALAAPELLEICTPVVFSHDKCFMLASGLTEIEQPVPLEVIASAKEVMDGRVNLVNVCGTDTEVQWGQQTETGLKAEADSLNAAIEAFKNHQIDVLVCAPGRLDNDLDSHSLSDFIRQASGAESKDFDWIIDGDVRTLKLHSLAFTTELGEGMAIEAFMSDMNDINRQLREDFGMLRPRIAVVSGNEKLGGDIKELQESGMVVFGPFEAKDFIETGKAQHYDAVLFLEQEQERHQLIKGFCAENLIGYVSGLPIVLTYPLTGVCYDKAGKGVSDESSLRTAIYAAIDIYRRRSDYAAAISHPLEKQWNPKGRDDFKLDLTKEDN